MCATEHSYATWIWISNRQSIRALSELSGEKENRIWSNYKWEKENKADKAKIELKVVCKLGAEGKMKQN